MTDQQFTARILAMQDTLYRVSYSLLPVRLCDREDAVQACIEKAWRQRDRLREDAYLETWMIRILINECKMLLRKRRRELLTDKVANAQAPPASSNLELHDLLLALPERLRLPAVLYYVEDKDLAEIARVLRVPEGTVKSRLHSARRMLKDELEKEGGAPACGRVI